MDGSTERKYMWRADSSSRIKAKQGASNAWQGISKIATILEKGKKMEAISGKSILF